MADTYKLHRAMRLTVGRVTLKPDTFTALPGPITQLGEQEMLARLSKADAGAALEAFEHFGGPFGGVIRFYEDANYDLYAADCEPTQEGTNP